MRISDVLSVKGSEVLTIDPDATVAELVERLRAHNVGAVIVSVDGRAIDGIVSERDVVRHLAGTGRSPAAASTADLSATVRQLMTAALRTCAPDTSLEAAMSTMTEHRVRHLPVVSAGTLVGIVSIGDVVKATIEQLRFERDQLQDYVSSGG